MKPERKYNSMSTTAQINANRENAKLSTGPVTQAGSERSSRNATKHGLTGQTMLITPEEAEGYAAHVEHYMERYKPMDHYHRQLVQQLADSDWGVHQVFLQQSATISLMHMLTQQLSQAGADPAEMMAADAMAVRKLATLNSYENRKRRTSKLLLEQIQQLEEQRQETPKPKQTKPKRDLGFVFPEWMTQEHFAQMREYILPFVDENGGVPEEKIEEFIATL
jgi:hypothetical protein